MHARKEPKTLVVQLVSSVDPDSTLLFVQLVIDLFVDLAALVIADGEIPLCQIVLFWKLLDQCLHAPLGILPNQTGV